MPPMTSIHDRARLLSAQKRIPIADALAELGRRGTRARRAKYGRMPVTDRQQAETRKAHGVRFWWDEKE